MSSYERDYTFLGEINVLIYKYAVTGRSMLYAILYVALPINIEPFSFTNKV